jgi:hypothetical protein
MIHFLFSPKETGLYALFQNLKSKREIFKILVVFGFGVILFALKFDHVSN